MTERLLNRCRHWLAHPLLHDPRTLLALWVLLPVVSWLLKLGHNYNNFLIYRHVFWHTTDQTSLYATYPAEYFDSNHYGPLFSLVVAPFALPPAWLGLLLWLVALSVLLYAAIRHSTFNRSQQLFILWFCTHELFTALEMQQFNIAVAALLLLSFCLIERERECWATFCIVLGTLVKLYGIGGLPFLLFSRHKLRAAGWLLFWSVVLWAAPMLISSPGYVMGQYAEWLTCLAGKNDENLFSLYQNISLLGIVRKVTGDPAYSDLWLLVPGLVLAAVPCLRWSQYRHEAFRRTLLASVLLFVVLFSTGSENSTYIIALTGAAIWYVAAPWQRSKADGWLMVFVFVLSSLGHTDITPPILRDTLIRPYALKALPCVLVWLKLTYEMTIKNYSYAEE